MEEARSYWNMWTKRKNTLNSQVVASSTYGDSWEEQAFAEDAAGPLGGCIWPPRSYTCSFCRREFRSAQALGGHMNVHRRDRARLKQSPTPSNNILSPTTSLATQYPSQVRMLAYNKDSDHDFLAISPTRVSVPVAKMINCGGKALLAPSPSSFNFKEQAKRASILVSPPLWSNILDLDKEEKNLNFLDTKYRAKRDYAAADLAVSLNFVVCRKDQKTASSGKEDHDNIMSFKRRRVDDDATVSFFPKQSSVDRDIVYPQLEVIQVCPSSKEDLDLELRLGDRSA